MEPERGRYDWDWLDRAIDVLDEAGLQVVLATPTAVPPVWLCVEHPEILSVGPDGIRRAYGSRRFNCPTAPAYREASRMIAETMVARYGDHPAIVAWQLDNEPGNHDSARCWCDLCETAFHAWLHARYGTIDELNRAWGTVFWNAVFPSFETIRLPRPTTADHSPALLLAHRRFSSGQAVDCIVEQHHVVKAGAPGRKIFTNLPAFERNVDPRAFARAVGEGSVNVYPTGMGSVEDVAFLLDLARGHTGSAWIMEHQPGPINWTPTADPVPPGQVRLWGWRSALHGFDAMLFFSWQTTRFGSEQYHTGLLRHDGSADRGLAEVTRLAAELRSVDPAILRRPPADVAVLAATEDHWAIEIDPHRAGLTHHELVTAAHAAARRLGWEVDVVAPEDDLTGYRLVLGPALQFSTPARRASLRAALDAGVTVVLGARSLVKDLDDCWVATPLPDGFTDRLGTSVTDWFGLHDPVTLAMAPGEQGSPAGTTGVPVGPWAEVLAEPADGSGTQVLARYETGWLSGLPAAVRGHGVAYLGATSIEAWLAVLEALVGTGPAGVATPDEERFVRDGRVIVLDHRRLTTSGLPGINA
jgi:beta-galactosidase